ncbi:MAG: SCP2 domain-containing protein [Hyphomicrobiaceae bacterium]
MGIWSLALAPLQPLLGYVVGRVAAGHPALFDRLGPHRHSKYVIDPIDVPFALLLSPDPDDLRLSAVPRSDLPPADARISGTFLQLVRLIDGEEDGDAAFFSRELAIAGNTEAVVSLRNAIDDMDRSLAVVVADLIGPPGRLALSVLRRTGGWRHRKAGGRA